MCAKAIIDSNPRDRLPHSNDCGCESCQARRAAFPDKPGMGWSLRRWICLVALGIISCSVLFGASYGAQKALAREGKIGPVRAPAALLKARAACPNTATPVQCRAALRRAYAAVSWQRKARNKAHAYTSRDVVLDAIQWASEKYHVPAWQMRSVGTCESHLFWLAQNGQYKSWAQLSSRHQSDPVIARLTWRDPYAVADHVARYVKRYGWSEWQCTPGGGLRW